jgi:hypothetical protein
VIAHLAAKLEEPALRHLRSAGQGDSGHFAAFERGGIQRCHIKTIDSDAVIAKQKLEHATNMQLEAKNNKPAGRLPVM